jgi:hypothetical protein
MNVLIILFLGVLVEIVYSPRIDYLKDESLLILYYSSKTNGIKERKRLIYKIK